MKTLVIKVLLCFLVVSLFSCENNSNKTPSGGMNVASVAFRFNFEPKKNSLNDTLYFVEDGYQRLVLPDTTKIDGMQGYVMYPIDLLRLKNNDVLNLSGEDATASLSQLLLNEENDIDTFVIDYYDFEIVELGLSEISIFQVKFDIYYNEQLICTNCNSDSLYIISN